MEKVFEILSAYSAQIMAIIIPVLLLFIKRWLEPKVKIVWGQANNSFHLFPKEKPEMPDESIYTEKLFVRNSGSKPSSEIELIFNSKPDQVAIFPEQRFTSKTLENNNYALEIPYLPPKGMAIVDIVTLNGKNSKLHQVNCKDVISKNVNFQVIQKFPNWVNLTIAGFSFFGFSVFIYLNLRLIGI